MVISGEDAWRNLAHNPKARWASEPDPARAPIDVDYTAPFQIDRSASFFCIGSCFARNVEEHLAARGIEPLSRKALVPRAEWPNRPAGLMNKFTILSALNELRWTLEPQEITPAMFEITGDRVRDLQLSPAQKTVSLERAIARRSDVSNRYFRQMLDADVIIFTLGLNEVWRDLEMGWALNAAPSKAAVSGQPGRFILSLPSASECAADLSEFYDTLAARRQKPFSFVLSVSPVPMEATATGLDVRVANSISKSTLRAAAAEFIRNRPQCAYFPSYEMITQARKDLAFAIDELHVRSSVVRSVIGNFTRTFIGELPQLVPDEFSEFAYLQAKEDVDDAVRSGSVASGIEHYLQAGKAEGRSLYPANPSAALKISGALE